MHYKLLDIFDTLLVYFEMIIKGKEYLQLYIELFKYIFIDNNVNCNEHKELFMKYLETKNIEFILP